MPMVSEVSVHGGLVSLLSLSLRKLLSYFVVAKSQKGRREEERGAFFTGTGQSTVNSSIASPVDELSALMISAALGRIPASLRYRTTQ